MEGAAREARAQGGAETDTVPVRLRPGFCAKNLILLYFFAPAMHRIFFGKATPFAHKPGYIH